MPVAQGALVGEDHGADADADAEGAGLCTTSSHSA
jgi:hypothetical protein